MKTIKIKFFLIAFCNALILALLFYNCSNDKSKSNKYQSNDKKTVFIVLKNEANPFFKEIQNGVESVIDTTINLQVRSGKDESDVVGQEQILKSIIQYSKKNKVDGILLTPSSSGIELVASLKELLDNNIPIILIDTKIDSLVLVNNGINQLPYIGSSNYEGGKQAGHFINTNLKKPKASILVLGGVENQETAIQRKAGFESYYINNQLEWTITYREAKWSRADALTITASFYSLGRKFDAIFASNDEMALGALQATLNKNITPRPIIVGFDAISEAKESIENNGLNATIAQNPKLMGEKSIELLNSIWNNDSVKLINYIATEIILK